MRKLLKSKKALSPVIAAIILIAVTVAVSIAVAAWMGSLSMGFMETKEITINELTFDTTVGAESIQVDLTNTGTSTVTISQVRVNGNKIDPTSLTGDTNYDFTFEAGQSGSITISLAVVTGQKYSVSLFASDGTLMGSYTDTAPS